MITELWMYFAGIIGLVLLLFGILIWAVVRSGRNGKKQTLVLFVDPRSPNGFLWQGRPVDGRITIERKGQPSKDFHLQGAKPILLPDGRMAYVMDWETGAAFQFTPDTDEKWYRMPPEKLWQVRKDTRFQQIGAMYASPWEKIAKYGLIGLIFIAMMVGGVMMMVA